MNGKNTIFTLVGIMVILITVVGLTYAFFAPQAGGTTSTNATVTSNTTDLLTFSMNQDISFTVTQAGFASGAGNQYGEATATVTLTPNNKTGSATRNYYMYLNLQSNPIVYSSTNPNEDPELMLQVFDGNNQLVTLNGVGPQIIFKGITGYDITAKEGLLELLSNHAISASNNTATIENWKVRIILINLDVDQNDNTGKIISGEIILREDATTYCAENPDGVSCKMSLTYNPAISNTIDLDFGNIYHHDTTLANGARDWSYRYGGVMPNNYICFGSDAATCPATNIYRIIGLIPVDVVTNSQTTPITTETMMLWKIIKNDYATSTELGMSSAGTVTKIASYNGPTGNQTSGNIEGFYRTDTLMSQGLNNNFIATFSDQWSSIIENVMWEATEQFWADVGSATPMDIVYKNEIKNEGLSSGNRVRVQNKVGLLYLSDYGYAAQKSHWTRSLDLYRNAIQSNWLYRGVSEWLITRRADIGYVFYIYNSGNVSSYYDDGRIFGIRPTFYLNINTFIDMANHAGTITDPYRIILNSSQ